jgi:hypothetical protein
MLRLWRNAIVVRFETSRLLGLVEDVGEMALATVLAVVHGSHEDTSAALSFVSR